MLAHGVSATALTKEWDQTPLEIAANRGHLSIVNLLLENGCEIDAEDLKEFTPLQEAASQGHIDVVRYLLQIGAACDGAASSGYTPLCSIASRGYLEIIALLLNHGANPTPKVQMTIDHGVTAETRGVHPDYPTLGSGCTRRTPSRG